MTINIISENAQVTTPPWSCRGEKGEQETHSNTGMNHDFDSTRNNGKKYCLLVWQQVMVAYVPEVNISSRENFQ
jgi:hypothetical protein